MSDNGSVPWTRIDNVPVAGRLVVISRSGGVASNYDCCYCLCPLSFDGILMVSGDVSSLLPGDAAACSATAEYEDCNALQSYYGETGYSTWSSSDTTVATVDSSGNVSALAGGTCAISATYSDCNYNANPGCTCAMMTGSGQAQANVRVAKWAVLSSDDTTYQGLCGGFFTVPGRERVYDAYDDLGRIPNGEFWILNETVTSSSSCGMRTDGSGPRVSFTDDIFNCQSGCTFTSTQTFTIGKDQLTAQQVQAKNCATCTAHTGWKVTATTSGVTVTDY